jgi:phospholipase C
MYLKDVISKSVHGFGVGAVTLSALQLTLGGAWASPFQSAEDSSTRTPIKHVIVIIGENRTFDHIFATYKPKKGETVDNLLSKEIIREDNSPGPNFSRAVQYSAVDTHSDKYQVSPMDKSLYETLPPPCRDQLTLRTWRRGAESNSRTKFCRTSAFFTWLPRRSTSEQLKSQ